MLVSGIFSSPQWTNASRIEPSFWPRQQKSGDTDASGRLDGPTNRKETIMISLIIIRSVAVVLAGMYAMRTAHAPMVGRVEPLTFLPLAVLVLCIFIFHRTPNGEDWWTYTVLAFGLIGFGVNILFMRIEPVGSVDHVISILSAVGWASIAVVLALTTFGTSRA
jgi:hypothetical protein